MSLDRTQRVDIDLIAKLLNVDVTDARALVDGLVYPSLDDPDELIPAVTAVSGNVRLKLADAVEAADTNPIYNDYVTALRAGRTRRPDRRGNQGPPRRAVDPRGARRPIRRTDLTRLRHRRLRRALGRQRRRLPALRAVDDRNLGHAETRLRRGQFD